MSALGLKISNGNVSQVDSGMAGTEVRHRLLYAAIAAIVFLEILDASAIAVLIPPVGRDMSVSELRLKGIIAGYVLGAISILPLIPWLAKVAGERRALCGGLLLFGIASASCALAPTAETLMVLRTMQGIGAGLMGVLARAVLVESTPKHRLARTMGYVAFPAMLAPAVGPLLAGLLADTIGWRWFFGLNLPLALLLFGFCLKAVENQTRPDGRTFDGYGAALLVLSFLIAALLVQETGDGSLLWQAILAMIIAALWLGYASHARRNTYPAVSLHFFASRQFRGLTLGNALIRLAVGGVPLLLALVLQNVHHQAAVTAGASVAAFAVGMALARPFAGHVAERYGHRTVFLVVSAALLVLLPAIGALLIEESLPLLWAAMFLLGIILSVAFNSLHAAAYEIIEDGDAVAATALLAMLQQAAMAASGILVILALTFFSSLGADVSVIMCSVVLASFAAAAGLVFFRGIWPAYPPEPVKTAE